MRKTAVMLASLLALVMALPAGAQTDKAPAKPTVQEPATPEAAKPESKRMARKHNPKRSEDARHCLDKANNTEIIKCAEAYL
jgi:hypothetical protein